MNLGKDLGLLAKREVLRRLGEKILAADLSGLAAEVSYYALLACFPFLMLVASIMAVVTPDPERALGQMLALLHWLMPTVAAGLLTQFMNGPVIEHRPVLVSIGIVGVVWASSNGFASILKALNRIYSPSRTRSWIRHRTASLGVMARVALASLAALLVMTGMGPTWLIPMWIDVPPAVATAWVWCRWPVLFAIVSLVSTWLYAAVPEAKLRGHWATTGGILTSVLWLAAGSAFTAFADLTNPYVNVYGAASSMIMLLVWIYLGVYLVLVGAAINATLLEAEARE